MFMKSFTFLLTLLLFTACGSNQQGDLSKTFNFEMNFSYPGDPLFVYDHLTGDISGWWDHSFSENPYRLYIEARPGGGFYELFNESGDGAKHATVIYAERGRMVSIPNAGRLPGRKMRASTLSGLVKGDRAISSGVLPSVSNQAA